MAGLRFVFDQHVNAVALRELRSNGIDIMYVAEAGLSDAADAEILGWAAKEDRILITRNYRDFAPLVDASARQGILFPGVLFYARSVRQSEVGHHVRALREWIGRAEAAGDNPVQNGLGWLRLLAACAVVNLPGATSNSKFKSEAAMDTNSPERIAGDESRTHFRGG